MNYVHLIGRLGRDPETRTTQGGTPVVNATLAVGKRIKSGEEQTTWVRLVFWDRLATIVQNHCVKGSQVAITGELQVREYVKDGAQRSMTEVRVHSLDLLGKPSGARAERVESAATAGEDFDDEIPF